MSFDTDFLKMFKAVVSYRPASTRDSYGSYVAGTVVSNIPARIRYTQKIFRRDTEDRILATAVIWLPPPGLLLSGVLVPAVKEDAEFSLPNNTDGNEVWRHVIMVDVPDDESGDYYQKSWLT